MRRNWWHCTTIKLLFSYLSSRISNAHLFLLKETIPQPQPIIHCVITVGHYQQTWWMRTVRDAIFLWSDQNSPARVVINEQTAEIATQLWRHSTVSERWNSSYFQFNSTKYCSWCQYRRVTQQTMRNMHLYVHVHVVIVCICMYMHVHAVCTVHCTMTDARNLLMQTYGQTPNNALHSCRHHGRRMTAETITHCIIDDRARNCRRCRWMNERPAIRVCVDTAEKQTRTPSTSRPNETPAIDQASGKESDVEADSRRTPPWRDDRGLHR